jgi:hypothetical protein
MSVLCEMPGNFRSAFVRSQLPDKPTLFRLLARFGKISNVNDRKGSDRPTTLNDSVENIRNSLVKSTRKFKF